MYKILSCLMGHLISISLKGVVMLEQFLDNHIKSHVIKQIIEWFLTILVTAIVCIAMQSYIFRIASVNGVSMEPTLVPAEKVIVSNIRYLFEEPKHNDVIAFIYRGNKNQYLVKRIAGVEGDEIDFIEGEIYRNGEILEDCYGEENIAQIPAIDMPVIVPKDSYFVLGDNRYYSSDSRTKEVGFVHKDDVVGRIVSVFWPFENFRMIY